MALYDEEEMRKKSEKSRKLNRAIVLGIIITTISIIALMVTIFYLIQNPNKITVYIDGKQNTRIESLLRIEKNDKQTLIYTPIKDIANFFGYKSNDGEYTTNYGNEDSCYVQTTEEIIIFNLDSDIIYKLDTTTNNSEYEAIKIISPITKKENKLCINVYGLRDAFNMYIPNFNEKNKKLEFWTLEKLVNLNKDVATKFGYKEMDLTFSNQKALLENLIVVKDTDGKMGVINQDGKKIVVDQCDKITYIPQKQAFLVEINGKVGIYGNDGEEKIEPIYDELTLIDADNELYLAKNNGKYGVVDINGQTKIFLDYDRIGIDISQFSRNGVKSGYILLRKLIPVQQNGKWIFYKIETTELEGKKEIQCKLINLDFEGIGCITKTKQSNASNLMVLEDYEVVVVKKNGYYGFMDIDGKAALQPIYSDAYMQTSSGNTNYYIVHYQDGKTYNAIEELEKRGYTKK